MIPFQEYDLRQMLENQFLSVNKKIDSMSNEEIMANDLEVIAENFYQEFFVEPITLQEEDFAKRKISQSKIRERINPFYNGLYSEDYIEVDGIIALFCFPYYGEKKLFKCKASSYCLSRYPEIEILQNEVNFSYIKTLDEMEQDNAKENLIKVLKKDVDMVRQGLSFANNDVNAFNASLKEKALAVLKARKHNVEAFYTISTMFEVPIEKKEYAQNHIPLKRNIVPVTHKYEKSDYFGITDKDYFDILSSIKHTLSTYERTPNSYQSMKEEDLRNTLLATLNATYKGGAVGEAFRNNGKTDICIERENRAAFVAECKMWTGAKAVQEAILQLDSYLTWRDCKTALIYFVRRKNYLSILKNIKCTLESIDNIRAIKEVDRNEFDCLYLSESNPGQKIRVRVMLFNLYC